MPIRMVTLVLAFLLAASLFFAPAPAAARGSSIEDFESGSVTLESYPDQDHDPSSWELTTANPFGGNYALRIYGNSWKTLAVDSVALDEEAVWQVAIFVERLGEMQGFGIGDGTNELLYTFAGSQLPQADKWWTVYQGAFDTQEWRVYLLPVGRDWLATHGSLPTIDRLVFVNDDDGSGDGVTIFDEITDVTGDLPVAPTAAIVHTVQSSKRVGKNLFLVDVQFQAKVVDPDSPSHEYRWDFGDGETSTAANPAHSFLVEADYTYTVGLTVRDPDGLVGCDTAQIFVEPGEGDLPLTVNFVGDVFTGRGYENGGGIIDTYGIEALFEPTLPILGQAADVNVCNLECAYTDRGSPHPTKSVVFRSRPENIAGIEYAGIDLVTLGNNHIVDYGEEGLLQTTHLLDSLGIVHSGAGVNEYFALLPTFYTERGVRMAFLGQSNRCGRAWNYQPFLDAGYDKPGFGFLVPHNVERAIAETQGLADVVILQLHSGDEYETAPPEKGWPSGPMPVEVHEIGPDDPDFRFRTEPTLGDRALRRLAIDIGADVVINHHPHVLQGFESYQGRLIAHSLGNFIFDLYYPETMPTMVLTLEIDKSGIVGYTIAPAWIDDWIPQPATGALAREILDRLADYSRPMNALLAFSPTKSTARIHLDRAGCDSTVTGALLSDSLVEESSAWISPPLPLAGDGNFSRVLSVDGAGGGAEIRWGREILWHGGFEEEGATLWDDNTADEWIDSTASHSGHRSLALRRDAGAGSSVGTDLERHLPADPAKDHSCLAYQWADNAADAKVLFRFYSSRYSESPLTSDEVGTPIDGSTGWIRRWSNLDTPGSGVYFEVRCSADPPASGSGMARFDDIAFIEWEPWVVASPGPSIPSPNNFRFLQVRGNSPGVATVSYEETAYGAISTDVASSIPAPQVIHIRSFPNPFNPKATIQVVPPGNEDALADVHIYDIRGRHVARIHEGALPGGRRTTLTWDGNDERGRTSPSGVYFVRVRVGHQEATHKMVLLR